VSDTTEPRFPIGALSGLGTSAARLRPAVAAIEPDPAPATTAGDDRVVVWQEPAAGARRAAAGLLPRLPREAPGAELLEPGRPRLLYPAHWQSPYPQGSRYATLFERGTIDWLTRFGLIVTAEDRQTIDEFECGLYGGLSSPTSNLRDGLLLTQFVSLWLYFDDRVIEDSSAFNLDDPVASMTPDAGAASANGFVDAWSDLLTRIRQTQSEGFMQRLGDALKKWIENARLETDNAKAYQRTGELPPFATMLEIRTVSIGMYPTFFLLEMAEGFELPDEIRDAPALVELKRLASRLVGYGNDVGGLAKDLHGNWPNLVVALQAERGLALEDAFDEVIRMHNADVETFDALARLMPSWGPERDVQVDEWLQVVRYSVLGFTFWESLATRYQKFRATAGGRLLTAPVTVFVPAGVDAKRPMLGEARTVRVGA